jgi:hypothetical protein
MYIIAEVVGLAPTVFATKFLDFMALKTHF